MSAVTGPDNPPPSWDFIWRLFMSRPRTRAWLFERETPPLSQVVCALGNSPMLQGYIFGAATPEALPDYRLPDIGDIAAVFSHDGPVLLGFTLSRNNIQPVLPTLYDISADPRMSDAVTITRQTARQISPYPGPTHWLSVECNWYRSGVLSVVTSANPCFSDRRVGQIPPPFDHIETRFFHAKTAQRMHDIVQQLGRDAESGFSLEEIFGIPDELLNPSKDFYILRCVELESPASCPFCSIRGLDACRCPTASKKRALSSGAPRVLPSSANPVKAPVVGQFAESPFTETALQMSRMMSALSVEDDDSDISDLLPTKRASFLWRMYLRDILEANEGGVMVSRWLERSSDRPEGEIVLRDFMQVPYRFLSSKGLRLQGQIQHICVQLGIDCGSPRPDQLLMFPPKSYVDSRDDAIVFLDLDYSHAIDASSQEELQMTASRSSDDGSTQYVISPSWHGSRDGSTSSQLMTSAGLLEQEESNGIAKRHRTNRELWDESTDTLAVSDKFKANPNLNIEASPRDHAPTEFSMATSLKVEAKVYSKAGCEVGVMNDGLQNVEGIGNEARQSEGGSLVQAGAEGLYPPVWKCNQCGILIRGKRGNLTRHISNRHLRIRSFACEEDNCGRKFQTRLNLERHTKAVHLGRPFACQICPRTFKNGEDLSKHINNAHSKANATLACDICGSCFGRRSTRNRHIAKVHKIAPARVNSASGMGAGDESKNTAEPSTAINAEEVGVT